MTIGKDNHGCTICRSGSDTKVLQQLGKPKKVEYLGGKAKEYQTFFKCLICGAQWVRIVESGAGGHGNFWQPKKINEN